MQSKQLNDLVNFNYEDNACKPDPSEEHPLMSKIRAAITKYRVQSAAHFDVWVDVKQAFRNEEVKLTRQSRLTVLFVDFHGPISYVCRPMFQKHPRKRRHVLTEKVQIRDKRGFMPLDDFLNTNYPCFLDSVHDQQMQAWWGVNGKMFNWTGLPTELKEQVIQSCVNRPLEYSDYRRIRKRYNSRFDIRHDRGREFGIYEIVDKLTAWVALLGVSHQVRAITLRLCFVGSTGLSSFSITASSCCSLDDALNRLGRYHQMTEPNSLPIDHKTQALAYCYKQYPRIFPHLKRYAVFRHGLRKVHMNMDFIGYMHFFKVTTGGFERYLRSGSISYEVFSQLPHLNEVIIRLPRRPHHGWRDKPGQCGPRLFYDDFPCPRMLHRVIYERVAAVLTLYPRVKVMGFIDADESVRFNLLRVSAMEHSKWTTGDYDELYADCDGGIELEDIVESENRPEEFAEERRVVADLDERVDTFFPPKCRCVEKCYLVFNEREDNRRL